MLNAAAVILAGGRSTRMGTDKALVTVGENKMLDGTVRSLAGLFPEVIISANNELYCRPGIRTVPDIFPARGPLGGIHAGLAASGYQTGFFVACDMPFIEVNLITYMITLAEGYDAVVPRLGEYYQPLFAVYSKKCLPAIEELLKEGRNKIISFYTSVQTRFVGIDEIRRYGEPNRIFFNVNTPYDLDIARILAAEGEHGQQD